MTFSRKDLILLHKYKDDNYRKALIEHVVSLVKYEVFRSAMRGETIVRVSCLASWSHATPSHASLVQGVHFSLSNNIWDTNYIMW